MIWGHWGFYYSRVTLKCNGEFIYTKMSSEEARPRASKRPAPKKGGPDWQQAREEYGVFEHQRNPGRPAMYSSRIQQQSGAVETDLRAERVTQDWHAAVQRRDAERRTRARTSTE